MAEYIITNISPTSGSGGTDITATTEGIPGQLPDSLQSMGGMFSGDHGNFPSAYAEILDNQNYTSFLITVPDDIDPGDYHIQIFLATKEKIGPRITLSYQDYFKVTDENPTSITAIVPSSVKADAFPSQTFTLRGNSMLKINKNYGFRLLPSADNLQLRVINLENTTARVRPQSMISPKPGQYQLRAQLKSGIFIQSQSRLTVT